MDRSVPSMDVSLGVMYCPSAGMVIPSIDEAKSGFIDVLAGPAIVFAVGSPG